MTVLKDPVPARPASQHRHSSMAGSLPKSRPHAHSVSGALNPAHRVTRRKSMSSTAAANITAMAAAAKGMSGAPLDPAAAAGLRRPSKPAAAFRGPALASYTAMASSVPSGGSAFSPARADTALTDGPALASMPEADTAAAKARARRASEGARQANANATATAKADSSKRSGSDLRCEKCGKGYKHSSCLTKHLWEHTPEWQYTSKLLISKHQQVQLLEAASVLVAMNQESESSHDSDHSSPSASSDPRDGLSSADTTPPPQLDDQYVGSFGRPSFAHRSSNRYSTQSSSAYSQSYQSAVFSDNSHGHYRQWSNVSDRPTTSGTSVAGSYRDDDNDHADLAAAVGLLSCSYGTPKTGPSLPADVPPVPPLPAKFLGLGADSLSPSGTVTAQQSSIRGSAYPYRYQHDSKDVDMDDDSFADGSRVDDDDEGVFGRMEE